MDPTQIARQLGELSHGDVVLAAITPNDHELVDAIRRSFENGNEQGNARRLTALVRIEGEGALDLVRAVLEDTKTVGGIYSNLRNTVLALIAQRFVGHPALEASLWHAIEIDEYLDIGNLYPVMAAYDRERAIAIALPYAERGVGAALEHLARDARPQLLKIADTKLAQERGLVDRFIVSLGAVAREPDLAARIVPLADTVPAAAAVALALDPSLGPALADKITAKDAGWRDVAIKALGTLPAAEVFDRLSPWFTADGRTKAPIRKRIEDVVEFAPLTFTLDDPRWIPLLAQRLEVEDHAKLRGLIVYALARTGPAGLEPMLAQRDDKDAGVLKVLPWALIRLRNHDIVSRVRAALTTLKGKHKKLVERTLKQSLEK